MTELKNKLRDQSGASILMALLFFLLCSMVGASVLMASASNAGKIDSSRKAQQEYLLLSSALRLVCGELTAAEYYGMYDYESRTEDVVIGTEEDADGNVVEITEEHTHHKFTQTDGEFSCRLSDVLPGLEEKLDLIFASKFPTNSDFDKTHYEYEPKSGTFSTAEYEITVQASGVEGLEENAVDVRIRIDKDLHIWLTATLPGTKRDDYVYTMEAQLSGQTDKLALLGIEDVVAGENKAGPVTWTLEWIAKKEAG